MVNKNNHGGARPGSGRPPSGRDHRLTVYISGESSEKVSTVGNKSEYIDNLIKKYIKGK